MTPITREQAIAFARRYGLFDDSLNPRAHLLVGNAFVAMLTDFGRQVSGDLARKSEVRPAFRLLWKADEARYKVTEPNIGDTDCYTVDTIASLQAKLEQFEARVGWSTAALTRIKTKATSLADAQVIALEALTKESGV